jgi:hypothetical protein
MLRCMQIAELIEQQVLALIQTIIQVVQTVCREIVTTIEEWQSRWEKQCQTVKKQVCRWLPWPLNKLCDWVTDTVCAFVQIWFTVIKTIVQTVCEVITSFIKIFILVPMTILVTIIRIVCFIVDFIVNWVKIIIAAIVGIPEFLTCMLGLRIRKHLHACVTVLAGRDGVPVMSEAEVDRVLEDARRIISERFNVNLHVHGRKILQVPEERLDVNACDASQLFSSEAVDLTAEASGTFGDLFGCGDNLVDIGAELIHDVLNIIFIRNIVEGDDVGCHIPGTDYVIIDRTSTGLVLAHEVGHAGDLWHVSDTTNLMNHVTAGDDVHRWQACIFRRSRFVYYSP